MATFSDAFRAWRRNVKAALPYVRRREHRILQRKYSEVIDGLGWTAPPATQARLHALKPLADEPAAELCLFVSHATEPSLKAHVQVHLQHLLRAGLQVVLILNTDLAPGQVRIDADLLHRLGGVYVRENVGFDFAAWAHLFVHCEGVQRCTRLFLVNDSIVGPLNASHFDQLMERVRRCGADVLGLTESQSPLRHVQSFFLVLNARALHSAVLQRVFARMLSLPTKAQVIDVYETRLTQVLTQHGLRCEALFPPLSDDPHSSNDTSFRWAELIRAGFPYVKTSILARFAGSAQLAAVVPAEFLPPPRSPGT
jgi:lipopolysaccharide biosynthesis protein